MVSSTSRRHFIATTSAAVAAAAVPSRAESAGAGRFELIGFIKPFQKRSFAEIAEISAEIGWDGIECPVRRGGTIEPEAVEDELPKLMEALKANSLKLPVIATDIEDASNALARDVLSTASKLGIRRYRMKHLYYDMSKPIAPQVEAFRPKLGELAQLNAEFNIQGTFQNHSGKNYVGAPVWDMWELIRKLDARHLAVYFDIGHATLEGGLSWPLQARLVEPLLGVVSVKDFVWRRIDDRAGNNRARWKDQWCPLGDGMVQPAFFTWLKQTRFSGPISTHYEYPIGEGKPMITAMKKDLAVLKEWLA